MKTAGYIKFYNIKLMKKILVILGILFFYSCDEEDIIPRPTVENQRATLLVDGGVELFGQINNVNNASSYGFVISRYEGGTLNFSSDIVATDYGKVDGEFSVSIRDGLLEGQTYYFNVFLEHENVNAYLGYEGNYIFGEEMSFVSNGSASPIINKVTPSIAHVGETIAIAGRYFSDDFNVYFNDKKAEIVAKSDTLVQVIVPFDYYRNEPYTNVSIKKPAQEPTIFEGFSMHVPEITAVEPYYAHEKDTITIIGNHFSLLKEQSTVSMEVYGDYFDLEIIESTRTEIKFVSSGRFYELYPRMRLKSQFQTVNFNDKFQAKLPTITEAPACISFGETATIYGTDFPSVGGDFNAEFTLRIGGVGFSAVSIARDRIVLDVQDGFYTDFILEDVVIEYVGETITYEKDICVNEPWIKVSFDNPQHQPHNYQNETYGVVRQNNNSFITVGKLNTTTHKFESVLNQQLPASILYGSLRAWHENKMYHYDISPNINKFYGYNFLNGNLEELAAFPGAQRVNGVMTCVGNYVYLGLGRNNAYQPFDDIWRYSIANNTWEFVLTYPGIHTSDDAITAPLVFSFDNQLFFGGRSTNSNSNLFWEIDLNTFSLVPRANVPMASAHGLKGATIGNKGYFEDNYLYEYEVLTNQWTIHEDIQIVDFVYPDSSQSLFTSKGNLYRSVHTSAPYYNLLFKMNMSYLE